MFNKLRTLVATLWAYTIICLVGFAPAAAGATDHLAKTIAPYLDEQSILVAHIDLDQIDLDAIVASAEKLIPIPESQFATIKQQIEPAKAMLDAFIKAGGHDLFAVCSLADLSNVPKDPPIFFVVPVAEGGDPNALLNMITKTLSSPNEIVERIPADGPIMIGTQAIIDRLRSHQAAPRKHLTAAFAAVDGFTGQVLVLPNDDHRRVFREMFPKLPEPLTAIDGPTLADGLLSISLGVNVTPEFNAQIVMGAKDTHAARRMAIAWHQLVEAASAALMHQLEPDSQNSHQLADSIKALLRPRHEKDRLTISLKEESIGPIIQHMLLPTVLESTQAAHRMQRMNQFKQIAIAMHNWHDKNKHFPPAAIRDADGKPLLSWRVAILPYLNEQKLYDQFHLDEPWDSDHNRQLVAKMPAIYKDAGIATWKDGNAPPTGWTTYLVPIGDRLVFGGQEGTPLKEIKDGTSLTILIVEVVPNHAVPWTKPADWEVDPQNPLTGVKRTDRDYFIVGICDGSVRAIENDIDPGQFWNMLTRAGGEVIQD